MSEAPSRMFILICLLLNIAMSIAIVLVNKSIYQFFGFPNITLTFIHFVCTAIGMEICRRANVFAHKPAEMMKMVPIALTFCGFVVFTNLSLNYNTVGTYQIIKSLTTPCVIFLQTYFYARSFSMKVKLTLVPITIGVFLNSYYDIKFNLIGVIFATIGVLVTSLYQVWVAEKQKEFSMNAMQLLYYQAPLSALFLAVLIPFFEPVFDEGGLFGTIWSMHALGMVLLSGVIAFGINLSIFWIIGNTSPLTYNMVGQFKFSMVVLGGFLLFKDPLQNLQLLGIFITFAGVFTYSWIRMKEEEKDKAQREAAAKQEVLLKEVHVVANESATKPTTI